MLTHHEKFKHILTTWRLSFGQFVNTFPRKTKKTLTVLAVLSLVFTDIFTVLTQPFSFLDDFTGTETARAATGDFATFSENGGGESVNSNGTPFDVTWDNTVDSNSNITLQANTSDIDLADGGKYLVLYNTWVHEGGSGGANRRGVDSYLTLAGTQLPYGRSAGYIRDNESLTTAWINGSTIIDATAGDDLQLHVKRNDGNSTAGTEMAAGENGVSIIKLPDGNDYLRAILAATSSSINGNTTFTDVQWDTVDEIDTDSFALTPTSANITLKGADGDYFIVNANVGLYVTAGGSTRQNYEMILTLDGAEIPGTAVTSYLRGTNDTWEGQLVYTGLIAKDAAGDQTLNVEVRRESSAGATTVVMGNKTSLSIMSVPTTAEVVRLSDGSGTQTLADTSKVLTFDTEDEINSNKFSHSLVSNTDRIEIDSADDYLFFATAYTETTVNSNDREPFDITWNLTGSDVSRGSFASFNRDNNAFTAGASGALLLSGLTASDYVAMSHVNASTDTVDDATFAADRVAVQGIALNDNFYGLDTVVSVSGAHVTAADISTTGFYTGGQFAIVESSASRNVTGLTIDESGTVDGSTGISNVELYYDLDTSAPYDCASESYGGAESQYGSTDSNGFSGADGSSSFTDSVVISPTQALCVYPVMDIVGGALDGDTLIVSIDTPLTDIVVTGGASIGPSDSLLISGSTVLRNAELTQIHYQWLNDDGVEGSATSIEGGEDLPAIGFANGTIRRLRTQISAEGSTSSVSTAFRLEYGQKVTTCSAIAVWTDVGAVGGDWDMANSAFITDGNDSSDLTVANGGTTNENTTHLPTNGALRDTNSQTGSLIFATTNFLELEYAFQPTATAPQGNTYCFRLSDAGTALRNYDIYPEGTISADVDVSATSTHVANLDVGSNAQYLGGGFVIERPGTVRAVTSVTLTEVGTVDASTDLADIELFYDLDTTAPYDCTGESYGGGETQFGSTDTDGFSTANGTSTFTGSETISSTRSMCLYVVLDVSATAVDGETIEVQIADPSTEVVVTSSSVGPSTAVSPTSNTTIAGPVLTQTHYHWRNDDGNEAGATSASGDAEDTGLLNIAKETTYRLRLQVSNEGSVSSPATTYRLEYGTKLTTCGGVVSWTDVGAVGGAWDMSLSSNIADGNTTDIALASLGAMTDENTNFIGTGALRETTSDSGSITLTSTQFTELEYSIEATVDSGYDTDYCFRVSDAGADLNSYTTYAELTTMEKQDYFIQRGNETVSGTGITLTAGVDYTAPASTSTAFVRITNSQLTG
ncbi:MAG: hypothetical protein LR008_00890, partial [Candidatus Pacebacteria bacterium]|nr:hypothetical protein [Candidatus Paceibacterota bacterium]